MSGEVRFNSIISSLENLNNENHDRLCVLGGKLHVWKNEGIVSKVQRFVFSIFGSFKIQDVSTFIHTNMDQLYDSPDLRSKLEGVAKRLEEHQLDSTPIKNVMFFFEKAKTSDPLKSVEGKAVLDSSVKDNYREQLQERFDQFLKVWPAKNGSIKEYLEKDFDSHLASLQRGESLDKIVEKWNEKAAKVQAIRIQYARMFPQQLRIFVGGSVVNELYDDFSLNILPVVLENNEYTIVEKQIERAIKNTLEEVSKDFKLKYGIECSLNIFKMTLDDLAIELRKNGLVYFGDEVIEEFMKKEFLSILFDKMSLKYKKKYGEDIDLSLIKIDSFVGFFDCYEANAKKEILAAWDKAVKLVVGNRNSNLWQKILFPTIAKDFEFLKLPRESLPSPLLNIAKKDEFEEAVRQWIDEQVKVMDKSALEYQEMMITNYDVFGKVVAMPFTPEKIYAHSGEEADNAHRKALLEMASKKFSEEYASHIILNPNIKDEKDFEEMGIAVNSAILDSLFLSHMGDIDLSSQGKVKYISREVHKRQCREIFNKAVQLMAIRNKLDPEQVLNGHRRLTGYDKVLMENCIADAVLEIHGNPLERFSRFVSGK